MLDILQIWLARFVKLVLGMAVIALVYAAWITAPAYIERWQVNRLLEYTASQAVHPLQQAHLRANTERKIRELNVPLTWESLNIQRENNAVWVSAEWFHDVTYFGRWTHEFRFSGEAYARGPDQR